MRRSPCSRPSTAAALVSLVALAIVGCGEDDSASSDAERFCGEIAADPDAVVEPPIGTEEELDATLAHYRLLADLAPVAIESEWRDLLVNLETASTVVPGDDESLQRAVAQAYATERSAVGVRDWLLANCSIDLGPVATIVPHERARPVLPEGQLDDTGPDDGHDPDGADPDGPGPDGPDPDDG